MTDNQNQLVDDTEKKKKSNAVWIILATILAICVISFIGLFVWKIYHDRTKS